MERRSPEERQLAKDLSGREVQVATCRRKPDGEWRMIARYDFLGQLGLGYSVARATTNSDSDETI
jgi:hypothetical protein